jgi:hypothetical protein
MKFLSGILIIFLSTSFVSCTKQQSPLTKEEVIAVIKRFDEGWKNKSLQQVDSVLAPSYIYFTQSGGIFGRESLVQTAGSPDYTLNSFERSHYFVKLFDNTAVVSTKWVGKGSYFGVPFDEVQRCSITIIKTNGKVEILTEHCTPIKPSRLIH